MIMTNILYFLGLFSPCPKHGDVRCCSREGLEALYSGMLTAALTQRPPRVQVTNISMLMFKMF
jgi:hypothetical protein